MPPVIGHRWRHLALNGKALVLDGRSLAIEPCWRREPYTREVWEVPDNIGVGDVGVFERTGTNAALNMSSSETVTWTDPWHLVDSISFDINLRDGDESSSPIVMVTRYAVLEVPPYPMKLMGAAQARGDGHGSWGAWECSPECSGVSVSPMPSVRSEVRYQWFPCDDADF